MFFQLVVARGKLTKDGGDADAVKLNPLETAQIINLLLRYYTARLPRGVGDTGGCSPGACFATVLDLRDYSLAEEGD